jgi:ABC-2 type transport system permease protein
VLKENGRLELLLAQPLGRLWAWRIAITWSLVTLVVLGCAFALVMISQQTPLADALLYGWSFTLDGWVMIGVTAICAQMSSSTRTVHTWAGVVMGLGYFCNANGRLRDNWLVWVSPVGWVQRTQPLAHNYWWVLVVGIGVTGFLMLISDVLMQRREYGAGVIAPRRGSAQATALLLGPVAVLGVSIAQSNAVVVGGSYVFGGDYHQPRPKHSNPVSIKPAIRRAVLKMLLAAVINSCRLTCRLWRLLWRFLR